MDSASDLLEESWVSKRSTVLEQLLSVCELSVLSQLLVSKLLATSEQSSMCEQSV